MYPKEMNEVNILGVVYPKRRSVFLEGGLDSAQQISRAIPNIKSVNKLTGDKPEGVIYETLKPLYVLMRLIGVFPVASAKSGGFRLDPRWFIYSSVAFLAIVGYVGYIEWDRVELVSSKEGRFEEAVISYLFTVYLLPVAVNPIVWYESKKLAKVLTDWCLFERIYHKVNKRKLSIYVGNKVIILCAVLPFVASATMVVTHITLARFKIVQVIPYCYINTIIYVISGFWVLQCDVLAKIATLVADDFQAALKNVGPTSQAADYRSLWMFLSKLIRDVGNASGYAITFLCLYLFLIITLTIYGLLSQLQAGFTFKDIGLALNAVLATVILFFICNEAHHASNSVRVQFQKKLLLVQLTWMKDDLQEEINMFLRATEMSTTDMSVVGFFDVNRNLFKSLLATMVTYLVVLLQFQISIPEDSMSDMNSTAVIVLTTQAPKQTPLH